MKNSYITFLSTDNYLKGVLVLKYSLDVLNSKYPLYCMVTKDVSKNSLKTLKKFDVKIIKIKSIKISNKIRNSIVDKNFVHWNKVWDKLNVFRLTQFKKVVYLDSDMIVCKNIDHLFDCENITAATDGVNVFGKDREESFNAGLMVICPSYKIFNDIIKFTNNLPEGYYQDQIVMQKYFSDWGRCKNLHLPENYNLWVPYIGMYPKEITDNIYVLHYIGQIKPFMSDQYVYCDKNNELCKKYYDLYYNYLIEVNKRII